VDVKVAEVEEMLEGSQSIVVRNVRVQGGNVHGKQEAVVGAAGKVKVLEEE